MEVDNKKNDENIIPNDADKPQKGVNVPNLRFNEFTHYWNKSTVRDSFILSSGTTPSRINGDYFNGNICWLTSGELKKKKTSTTLEKITEKARKIFNLKLFPKGTFVIATYGLEATGVRGTCTILDTSSTISQACMAFEPKGEIHNEFLYYWYLKYGEIIGTKYAQGTKQQNLSFDLVEGLTVYFPSSDEQLKICKFLDLLDQRIDTQSKIIEDLELFKKGIWNYIYLIKSNDWECVKLSNVLCERKDFALKGDEFIHATLSKDGIFAKTNRYDRDFLVTNNEKQYKITRLNDICYNPANLKFEVICLNKFGDAIFSPIYVTYTVKNDFIPSFVELILTSSRFLKYIRKYEQGTVYERMAVNSEDFLKGEILIPTKDKQKAIADYFDILDLKIKKEKDILELYKKQKEYLLKNMFI